MGLEQAPLVFEEFSHNHFCHNRLTIDEDFVFNMMLKLDNIGLIENENICISTRSYFQLFSSVGSIFNYSKIGSLDSNI